MLDKKKLAMLAAEFLGTAVFTLALYSILTRTSFPFFTGLAAGGVYAVMILGVGQVSGAHLNPAVTIAMWSVKKIETSKAIVYIASQVLGALAAWALLQYFVGHSLTNIADSAFSWKVFTAEGVGTAVFVFGAAASIYQKFDAAKCAAITLVAFAIGVMIASLGANAILNPAAALGIQSWSWSYATAPIVGAIVGMNVYGQLFAPEALKVASKKKK